MKQSDQPDPSEWYQEHGYLLWRARHAGADSDRAIEPFLAIETDSSNSSWLRRARVALMISAGEAAQRLGITRQAYCYLEKSEAQRSISLDKLAQAADALDCELIYAVRPKARVAYSRAAWERLRPEILEKLRRWTYRPQAAGHAMASIASDLMTKESIQKKLSLSRQRQTSNRGSRFL